MLTSGGKTEHLLASWLSIPVGECKGLTALKNNSCDPIAIKDEDLPEVAPDYLNLAVHSIPAVVKM